MSHQKGGESYATSLGNILELSVYYSTDNLSHRLRLNIVYPWASGTPNDDAPQKTSARRLRQSDVIHSLNPKHALPSFGSRMGAKFI